MIIPPIDVGEEKLVKKVLDVRNVRKNGKEIREYLCRFKDRPADQDEWRTVEEVPNSAKILRDFRASKRG